MGTTRSTASDTGSSDVADTSGVNPASADTVLEAVPETVHADRKGFVAGKAAPSDLYEIHGYYTEVDSGLGDGSTVTIERAYDDGPRFASTPAPRERATLVVSAGETVSGDVADRVAAK